MISDLCRQLDSSPTSIHLVEYWSQELLDRGFTEFVHGTPVQAQGFVRVGGALIAWTNTQNFEQRGIRIVGAHTDSPGLHIKRNPLTQANNIQQIGVEIYGGPLLNSWLDRDLGIAGVVYDRAGHATLVSTERAVARIPQLAIHLDREVNERGLQLDKQQHIRPIWSTEQRIKSFESFLAAEFSLNEDDIAAWSCQLFDVQKASLFGLRSEFLASARLDNQVSCWAAMEALLDNEGTEPSLVALFDHEEVGSESTTGAAGPLLETILERIAIASGSDRAGYLGGLAKSHCISADNAHAIHPNYPDRHDQSHAPLINNGIAIKTNSNQRYATTAKSSIPIYVAADKANINIQQFSSKNTMPCGSTIGPITATRLGIETVDIGLPQLAMHSAREMCGSQDPISLHDLLKQYFAR
jgi:aspartyl aminopeptidase